MGTVATLARPLRPAPAPRAVTVLACQSAASLLPSALQVVRSSMDYLRVWIRVGLVLALKFESPR
jgi:hypothetical protein